MERALSHKDSKVWWDGQSVLTSNIQFPYEINLKTGKGSGGSKKRAASSAESVLILKACFRICYCFITDSMIVSRFLMNSNSIYSQ